MKRHILIVLTIALVIASTQVFAFDYYRNIDFVDVGTSGGIEGARKGACTMVGASDEVFQYLSPLLRSISVEEGCLHTGPNGSGHYVKMIHNGI